MQKYVRFPVLFFFMAACVGLLLRWHFISPISWLKFPYWLHAHSHLMFLGWIFNLLMLAFIHNHVDQDKRNRYKTLFLIIQVLLLGMLISFPLQGYGTYSILLSTFHTIGVGVFAFWFFKDTKHSGFNPSRLFARISLFFFLISSLGPFTLGPLMVNGLVQTNWYYFAVYYYLHFQYNGVFTFGVLSMFFELLNNKGIIVDQHATRRFGHLMIIACFPAYFLSTLWSTPGLLFNGIGLVAALMQLIALFYFIQMLRSVSPVYIKRISSPAKILFVVALLSFIAKLILQLLSGHPATAQLAYEVRNYVMAYLHLVLVGMISSFLLGWCIEMNWIKNPSLYKIVFFLTGFVGMEIILVSRIQTAGSLINSPNLLFVFSCLMVYGVVSILWNALTYQRH